MVAAFRGLLKESKGVKQAEDRRRRGENAEKALLRFAIDAPTYQLGLKPARATGLFRLEAYVATGVMTAAQAEALRRAVAVTSEAGVADEVDQLLQALLVDVVLTGLCKGGSKKVIFESVMLARGRPVEFDDEHLGQPEAIDLEFPKPDSVNKGKSKALRGKI